MLGSDRSSSVDAAAKTMTARTARSVSIGKSSRISWTLAPSASLARIVRTVTDVPYGPLDGDVTSVASVSTCCRQPVKVRVQDRENSCGCIGIWQPGGKSHKKMKRFRRTSLRISIAGCAVLMYAALVVMSAGCMLAHADRVQAHHHHSEEKSSPQSAFCAWACQATSDLVAVTQPPPAVAWLVVEQPVPVPDSHRGTSASVVLHPRAPPVSVLLSRA